MGLLQTAKSKIYTKEQFLPILKKWRKSKGIVFTNGCFDLLHIGHVDYLEKARLLGNKLIVGMNTDTSVQRLKGIERPIIGEESRSVVLASLGFVDAVILFDEDTPFELIDFLKPDILVKGDDYKLENIVGADIVLANGGIIKTIQLVEGYSTSHIVKKIKNS